MSLPGNGGKGNRTYHRTESGRRGRLQNLNFGATAVACAYVITWAGLLGALANNLTPRQEAATIAVAVASAVLVWFSVRALMLEQRLLAERENMEALEESRGFARLLMDNLPAAIWLKTRDHRYVAGNFMWTEFNPGTNEFYGEKLEILLGHTDRELYGDARAAEFERTDNIVVASGRPWEGDYDETRDGRHFTFHVTKLPVFDRWGTVVSVAGIGTDITSRSESERKLMKERARFDSFLLRSPDHVLVVRADRGIVQTNAHMCEFLGAYPSELRGKDAADCVVLPDRERFAAFVGHVIADGSVSREIIRFTNAAGHEMRLEISGVLLASEDEAPSVMILGRHNGTDQPGSGGATVQLD